MDIHMSKVRIIAGWIRLKLRDNLIYRLLIVRHIWKMNHIAQLIVKVQPIAKHNPCIICCRLFLCWDSNFHHILGIILKKVLYVENRLDALTHIACCIDIISFVTAFTIFIIGIAYYLIIRNSCVLYVLWAVKTPYLIRYPCYLLTVCPDTDS